MPYIFTNNPCEPIQATENSILKNQFEVQVGMITTRLIRLTSKPMTGPDVQAVQERLSLLGFNPSCGDGTFTAQCRQALIRFQKSRHIKANGIVNALTWIHLHQDWPRCDIPPRSNPRIFIHLNTRILNLQVQGSITTYPVAIGRLQHLLRQATGQLCKKLSTLAARLAYAG